ncbi:MAG: hypothetical protein AAF664_01865, partial [Planctomycetota bacterium]
GPSTADPLPVDDTEDDQSVSDEPGSDEEMRGGDGMANAPMQEGVPRSGPRSAPPQSNTPFIVYSLAGVIAFVLAGPFGLKTDADSGEVASEANDEAAASDIASTSVDD